jgi:trehalose synthase
VLKEVRLAAEGDPGIHVLYLPSDSPRIINALQRGADIVLQKSTKEGFGLTVAEALWKMKPVIGGNAGGIRIQIINHYTGLLVNTPEGAGNGLRYLLQSPEIGKNWGVAGRRLVKENFLITRHLRDYLAMMAILVNPTGDRINLSRKPGPEPVAKAEK